MDYQDWTEAYKELCAVVKNEEEPEKGIPEINHLDLWRNQIEMIEDDYPWPSDSLFFNFTAETIKTVGGKAQEMSMRVDAVFVIDTIADSYHTSTTQDIALKFMNVAKRIHKLLQGRSGKNFSSLDRVGFRILPAHPSLHVLMQSYNCVIMDYSAVSEVKEATITKVVLTNEKAPSPPDLKLFNIPT